MQSNHHLSNFVLMAQDDAFYMDRCLHLARQGCGHVAPNPMVGAVLVYEGKIIGEGYHARYGDVHAEVACLQQVSPENTHLIPSSTLYVSLEPCCHKGKTPPCTDLILQSGVKKVMVATADPFPSVKGGGIRLLREAGVEVEVGLLEKKAMDINRRFFSFYENNRPYTILKWAQTSNHLIGGLGSKRWHISNSLSQRLVHQWRTEEQAILVGFRTAYEDNPVLTNRLVPGKNPLRMVIDPRNELPQYLQMFNDGLPTIVFNTYFEKLDGLVKKIKYEPEDVLVCINKYSLQHQIQSILVEGGLRTLELFLENNHWDEIRTITAGHSPDLSGIPAPDISYLQPIETFYLDEDRIDIYLR